MPKITDLLRKESKNEYLLTKNESVWISVKGFSICLNPTDEGIVVDIFEKNRKNDESLASTYAFDSETEEE